MGEKGQTGRWLALVEQLLANLLSGRGIFIYRQSLGAAFHAKPACVQPNKIPYHLQRMPSSSQHLYFCTSEYIFLILAQNQCCQSALLMKPIGGAIANLDF